MVKNLINIQRVWSNPLSLNIIWHGKFSNKVYFKMYYRITLTLYLKKQQQKPTKKPKQAGK